MARYQKVARAFHQKVMDRAFQAAGIDQGQLINGMSGKEPPR